MIRDEFITNHYSLVDVVVDNLLSQPRYKDFRRHRDDLHGEATVALIKAADSFDPSKGLRFVTFATHTIVGYCLNEMKKIVEIGRHEVYIDDMGKKARSVVMSSYDESYNDDDELTLVEILEPRTRLQQEVYYRVIILGDKQVDVAKDLGVSRTTVSKTKERLIKRIKKQIEELKNKEEV